MDRYVPKSESTPEQLAASVTLVSDWFGIGDEKAKAWIERKKTLEEVLNLGSEDAVITHFIAPFLRNALGYEVGDIDIKPPLTINEGRNVKEIGKESDVIVRKKNAPVMVIEAKSYGHKLKSAKENAEGQAFDYTRANELKPRPKYYIASNVEETHIYETQTRNELPFSPIREFELLEKRGQLVQALAKKNITPLGAKVLQAPIVRVPITDQRTFERILFRCQDDMREASESRTGIVAFKEMNKLLFIKLLEDRRERDGKENRFTIFKVQEEGDNYITTLFDDVKDEYRRKGITIFRAEDKIELDDVTVNRIVERLEKVALVDDLGVVFPPVAFVYENFVSTIFRGENGQYFTPRKIVDFMVKMSHIGWGAEGSRIVDPACGSGGFLLSAFAYMDGDLRKQFLVADSSGRTVPLSNEAEVEYKRAKRKLCEELLVGCDNEEMVAKTAAMNMSVHGDGSTGIHFGDSFRKENFKTVLKLNSFDIALTNPPFSSQVEIGSHIDVDGIDVLTKYEFGYSHKYMPDQNKFIFSRKEADLRSQDSKVLFIERCCELLKEGGTLAIIVDDGVLNNVRDAYVRDFIYRNFVIKAIVALPFDIFKEQDAHNYTSILFLQKKKAGLIQGDVFMAIAEHCGENFGKSTVIMANDLDTVHSDFLKYSSGEQSLQSSVSFVGKRERLENFPDSETKDYRNRLDPKYYHPRHKTIVDSIEQTGCARSIESVVDFAEEICPPDQVNSFGSKFIDRITNAGLLEFGVFDGVNDPKGAKDRIFRKGDLVASRVNLKSGMIAIVPDELDEVRATSEYYKLVPKIDGGTEAISRKYLHIVLTSEPIQYLMKARCTGQYGRVSDTELGKIKIPVFSPSKQREIVEWYEGEKRRVDSMQSDIEHRREQLMKEAGERIFMSR